jgi:hypothetical protein
MNRIRLATPEECEGIKAKADLDETCTVFALDSGKGTAFGVRRIATEIDPIIVPDEWDTRLRVIFWRDLETATWAQGAASYYFNVHCDDKEWMDNLIKWGAEKTSTAPEFRFKKLLVR